MAFAAARLSAGVKFRSPDLQDFDVTLVWKNMAPTHGRRGGG
jgi:hypothetical protein